MPDNTTAEGMKLRVKIVFSEDMRLYYVDGYDHLQPRVWLTCKGPCEQYPFTFYSIKSGSQDDQCPMVNPMVERYAKAVGWPERGSEKWRAGIQKEIAFAEARLKSASKEAQVWGDEMQRLSLLLGSEIEGDTNGR